VARLLNEIGVPPKATARKHTPHWQASAIYKLIRNPIYMGEVWVNRYCKVGKNHVTRPKEEWVLLPEGTAPAYVTKEVYQKVLEQVAVNKKESLRNNKHTNQLGLLRSGYIRCGICGTSMYVAYPSEKAALGGTTPSYRCQKRLGKNYGTVHHHNTSICVELIDAVIREKIIEILKHPSWVRETVERLREENTPPPVDEEAIEARIEAIRKSMQNLFNLAQYATDDETIATLTERMNNLEAQKREAESLLFDIADDQEERQQLEAEIVKFERWEEEVRPLLTDPSYKPSYKELHFCVRILGLVATIYPQKGDWPFRYQISATLPAISAKLNMSSGAKQPV
jgi:site-specific DNA recombinase